jgi:hypothetical protein
MRRSLTLVIPALLILTAACGPLDRLSGGDSARPDAARESTPSQSARTRDPKDEATATPAATPAATTTATATPKPATEPAKIATATPTATPAPTKQAETALSERVPACGELMSGASEKFRSSMSSEVRNGRGIDMVTLGCSTKDTMFSITVTRFADQDDAERGDALLRRSSPFTPKDRKLDLDRITADVVGGAMMPDDMGGLVTIGLRRGRVTASVAAQPNTYGRHVEDDAATLAGKLAEALG